jgi:hypothetical protein
LNTNHFAPQGKQTTDTADPLALRFGTLAFAFAASPTEVSTTAVNWQMLVGPNGVGTLPTGSGGTLQLIVVDTFYSNNTGGYNITISDTDTAVVPEPSAIWLAFSGITLLGFGRMAKRRRK